MEPVKRYLLPHKPPSVPGTPAKQAGMVQGSTDGERPVASGTAGLSSESPTKHFHVELKLSSIVEDELRLRSLLIEGLTFEEGSGIFLQVSAELSRIAGQVQSSGGESSDQVLRP